MVNATTHTREATVTIAVLTLRTGRTSLHSYGLVQHTRVDMKRGLRKSVGQTRPIGVPNGRSECNCASAAHFKPLILAYLHSEASAPSHEESQGSAATAEQRPLWAAHTVTKPSCCK